MSQQRDTQFAGAAKAYLRQLENKTLGMSPAEWTPTKAIKLKHDITTQFLYDFAYHVLGHIGGATGDSGVSDPADQAYYYALALCREAALHVGITLAQQRRGAT